ncbi:maleylpyruvate isomerase family mycothiol-dependent enzyme [Nocardioides sp. NPDC006273]|uniref:maleylpyruvate isomerase family mycothiol-dependent enzyme n=1 Tax=Nocardioides sp. NPDC006273 TaxID=3155598 RepID=UPI0033A3B563
MAASRTALATAERRDLADFLETLTPEQWDRPSLCRGWTVRDVVAHMLSYEEVGLREFAGSFLRAGFRFGELNARRLEQLGAQTSGDVVADVGWSHGNGAEVTGPGEALLMAISGRADALPELEGPGLVTLESRVRRTS